MSLESRARSALSQTSGTITLDGLQKPVEVIRDTWGMPHIYAQTEEDLFLAQGFVAAQDRLWQMEMWRRTGEGRLAEVLGPAALERDIFARLIRYRGDMEAEWTSYAPDARDIITSFVRGVNLYIDHSRDNLPIEFQMMGIAPEPWTPEVCLTRMAGYSVAWNAGYEVVRAILTQQLGPEEASRLLPTDPPGVIDIPEGLDLDAITIGILSGHTAAMNPLEFGTDIGSNNWVVDGTKSATGWPLLANDPHRALALPSLRYGVHLVGPGWNVIGAGEPALPGVALGHNERVAFGFTIFMADNQDIYVEETNPEDPAAYRYEESWEAMEAESQTFHVKGRDKPLELQLRYTRHGPVIHEDRERNRAYALRWAGAEPGTAGYLASLSLDRAENWESFLEALKRWKMPCENLVYADVDGNIGYQAAGIIPKRTTWSGVVPAPGASGACEWEGFVELSDLPGVFNPSEGFVATANQRTLAADDPRHIGYDWATPYRFRRIDEVLKAQDTFSVEDFKKLQEDVTSLVASELISLLDSMTFTTEPLSSVVRLLREWDRTLSSDSSAAAIYEMWYCTLVKEILRPRIPEVIWEAYRDRFSVTALVDLLTHPDDRFKPDPEQGRDQALRKCLITALMELSDRFGDDMQSWRWGDLHTATFAHPLADRETAAFLSRGPVPRGGDGHTVNNTSDPAKTAFAQTSGASYRQIIDVADWDRSVMINVPGQSGQPGSPHYDDLIPLWSAGEFHPMVYSRAAVEAAATATLMLEPE